MKRGKLFSQTIFVHLCLVKLHINSGQNLLANKKNNNPTIFIAVKFSIRLWRQPFHKSNWSGGLLRFRTTNGNCSCDVTTLSLLLEHVAAALLSQRCSNLLLIAYRTVPRNPRILRDPNESQRTVCWSTLVLAFTCSFHLWIRVCVFVVPVSLSQGKTNFPTTNLIWEIKNLLGWTAICKLVAMHSGFLWLFGGVSRLEESAMIKLQTSRWPLLKALGQISRQHKQIMNVWQLLNIWLNSAAEESRFSWSWQIRGTSTSIPQIQSHVSFYLFVVCL